MTDTTNYYVNAYLRLKSNFSSQIKRETGKVAGLSRTLLDANRKVEMFGRGMARSSATAAVSMAKMGSVVAGGVAIAGMVALVKVGTEFNNQLENTKLSLGSMYQLYGQNAGDLAVNLGQAEFAMKRLFDIAKKSPVSFGQATQIYQGSASQLIAANVSMQEQMKFMQSATLLKGVLPDMNATDIGSQLGRVIGGGAGAEFEVWKRLQPAVLSTGKAMGIFAEETRMGAKFTQRFNELALSSPREAFNLINAAVKPLDKLADEQANSWSGILSTTQSNMMWLSAKFTAPLTKMKKDFLRHLNSDGLLSDSNMGRIERVAGILGFKFAAVVEGAAYKLESWAQYVVDNWDTIFLKMKAAGLVVAGAIKGAFAFGIAKFTVGSLMAGGAGAVRLGNSAYGAAINAYAKLSPTKSAKGSSDKSSFLGRRYKSAFYGVARKRMAFSSAAPVRAGMAGLQITALTASMGPLVLVAAAAALAFAALGVIVAGIAVYVISNWDTISKSIRDAMDQGKLSLVPLITAAYTLWRRLEAVGKAFVGGAQSVSAMSAVLGIATSIVEGLSWSVSAALKVFAFSIRVWVVLKIAFIGLMTIVSGLISMLAKVGAVDDSAAKGASDYVNSLVAGTKESLRLADEMMGKADQISGMKLSPEDQGSAESDASELAEYIRKQLKGDSKDKKNRRHPKGPKVNIQNLTINQDLRDHDQDRLMAAFINPLERMADARIQSYEALDQGV